MVNFSESLGLTPETRTLLSTLKDFDPTDETKIHQNHEDNGPKPNNSSTRMNEKPEKLYMKAKEREENGGKIQGSVKMKVTQIMKRKLRRKKNLEKRKKEKEEKEKEKKKT